jgi:outer membrane protein assembly factor BamB
MRIDEMVFIGLNGRVLGMDRETGRLVWEWRSPKPRSGFVSVMLDGDRLLAGLSGYLYCLEAETGAQLWANPLTGYGLGIFSFASVRGQAPVNMIAQLAADEEARRSST